MSEKETVKNKSTSPFISILITQLVTVAIILLSLVAIKYFFKSTYNSCKEFYEKQLLNDTKIEEVIPSGGEKDEI